MLNLFYQGLFGEKLDERNDMGKIMIHCFETNGIQMGLRVSRQTHIRLTMLGKPWTA